MAIDLDRGVMTRFHPSGFKVHTYIGNAEGRGADPGTYFDENGLVIDKRIAREAGFDVERDLREKVKQNRLAEARAALEAEYKSEEDKLAEIMSGKGSYDVRHIGAGQYAIFDKKGADGKRLTRVGMTKADVEVFVGPLAPDANDPAVLNELLGSAVPASEPAPQAQG